VKDCEPADDDVCVTQQLVSVVDIFPTIAALAGVNTSDLRGAIDPTEAVVLDGYSLVPVLANEASTGRTTLYAEMFYPGGGGPYDSHDSTIRDANYKLVVTKCGEPKFYRYDPARDDEGDDTGVLDTDEELAYDLLLEEANRLRNAPYDAASTWPAGTGAGCPL
jgi:arylsulfatase A-like enzyme